MSFATLSFGQKDEKIKAIRKIVKSIDSDTNYTLKKLDNEYFVNKKNEMTDGGQELTGYYKNGQIRKIIYGVGLSYGMKTFEYYFLENELIFVFEKQDTYLQLRDSSGEITGFDYTKLEPVFEGRYYFNKTKLIETKNKGKEWFVKNEEDNKEREFLEDSKSFIEELKKKKTK
jgi:hypothetical protein